MRGYSFADFHTVFDVVLVAPFCLVPPLLCCGDEGFGVVCDSSGRLPNTEPTCLTLQDVHVSHGLWPMVRRKAVLERYAAL
eukprot:6182770-Prymnesium_polylepis.2